MADVTNLFKATVKTLRVRQKSLSNNHSVHSDAGANIFPHTKTRSNFAVKAKDVVGIV